MKATAGVLCILVALAACDRPGPSSSGQPSPASLLQSPKVSRSAPAVEPSAQAQALPKPDLSVPFDRYSNLNVEPDGSALSYVVTALARTPVSEEEQLNRLSPVYYAERDAFKRQALAKTELPRVAAQLDKYRQQHYYTVAIADYSTQALALTNLGLGPYDLHSRGFPLIGYGGQCWNGVLRNVQGAVLKLQGGNVPCSIEVADESTARTIEAARAAQSVGLAGTLYVFVPASDYGEAIGIVSRASVQLIDKRSKAVIGRFDLHG